MEELEPLVCARLRNVRATLKGEGGARPARARSGEDRLRVYRDGWIEGTATLRPETAVAPEGEPGGHRLGRSGGALRTCE